MEMFHVEAKYQIRQHKHATALASLQYAATRCDTVKQTNTEVMITTATTLLALGDYHQALRYQHLNSAKLQDFINRLSDIILKKEKQNTQAMIIKADSLFNQCNFEKALVIYHR